MNPVNLSTVELPAPGTIGHRRMIFGLYFVALLALGLVPMTLQMAAQGWNLVRFLLWLLFIPLFAQIVYGFAVASIGYVLLRRGGDAWRITELALAENPTPGEPPAIAVVMPIYNENVAQVFQRLRVMYDSLRETRGGDHFDFFILSDSTDPNHWIAEEKAWLDLCKQTQGFGRIFYRKRRVNLHHKSGNIADFCRRWGAAYRYMVVLDADSLMTGPMLVRLGALMEAHPRTGIIQTNPTLARGKTLYQRLMQFGTQLCGPMFSAGSNYWQLGSSSYWGHNAIIRLHPFMKHCAIPELPANSPLGRRVLSHDSIEAALMQKAGYHVWFAYDLEGGYEECPPSLPEALARDRRWCFGNMQHLYFLFAGHIRAMSRFHLFNGIMAYGGSLLWLMFLLLSTIAALGEPGDSSAAGFAFARRGAALLAYVLALLFLPKLLGFALILEQRRCEAWGGAVRLLFSVVAEMVFSVLMAPILMLFHAQFVVGAFLGTTVTWGAQKRGADRGSWSGALALFGPRMVFIGLWMGWILWWKPVFLIWLSLIFLGPLISAPLSLLLASAHWGSRARDDGWFLVPHESEGPTELRQMEEHPVALAAYFRSQKFATDYGLLRVILDPYVNAIHVAMLRQHSGTNLQTRSYINSLAQRILTQGPTGLDDREKRHLLWDAEAITDLHRRLWISSSAELAEWWQDALRHYNDVSAFGIRKQVNQG